MLLLLLLLHPSFLGTGRGTAPADIIPRDNTCHVVLISHLFFLFSPPPMPTVVATSCKRATFGWMEA